MRSMRMMARIFLLVSLGCGAVQAQEMWSVQTSRMDTNLRGVSAAFFFDAHSGPQPVVWASGSNGVILQSKDLGKTWKRLTVPGAETLDFRSIQAVDADKAYVMSSGEGDKSRIYKTVDGGATWKLQYTGGRQEFFLDALVCAEAECYALSDPVDGKFVILNTKDGEIWKELPSDHMPDALPKEGAFAASGTCLALYHARDIYFVTGGPAARVFHSPDGGATWTVTTAPIQSGKASAGIFSIAVREEVAAVVGGDYQDADISDRVAAYSTDEGKTWKLAEKQPGGYRSAVAWVGGKTLVAAGPNGEDSSDDGGANWKHEGSYFLNAVVILNHDYVWGVGRNGFIARMNSAK
jgi:photosystem II stability/assembly factor-like uncharacterized protein